MCYSEVGRLRMAKTLEVILLHAFNKKNFIKIQFCLQEVRGTSISELGGKILTLFQRGFVTYPLQRYIHLDKDNSEHNAPL